MEPRTAARHLSTFPPLIGRANDLSNVIHMLRGTARLVTLRGPGGIGKTALALHVLKALHAEFDHGVGIVELAPLDDHADVLSTVARTLGLPARGQPPLQALEEGLEGRTMLVLLDNFEHLRDAALDVQHLLDVAPHLRVLVTSRVPLHLHDEHEYPLAPLAVPAARAAMFSSPAVALFVERVRHHEPAFTLDSSNEHAVLRVCQALEGIPLALELAAAATRVFSVPILAKRLDASLVELHEEFVDRPERLRSMRAAVEWSFNLLPLDLQNLFVCCAVFRRGFTMEALHHVWGEDGPRRLTALLDHSLIQRDTTHPSRWRMLEPLRELALEQLALHPQARCWCGRHAAYYVTLAGSFLTLARERLEELQGHLERENLRAAFEWALTQDDADLALRALEAMEYFYVEDGGTQADLQLALRTLALPQARPHPRRLRGLQVAWECIINMDESRLAHSELLFEWTELSRAQDDLVQILWSTLGLVVHHIDLGDVDQADVLTRELFELYDVAERSSPESSVTAQLLKTMRASAYLNLGCACIDAGELLQGQRYVHEALRHFVDVDVTQALRGRLLAHLKLTDVALQLENTEVAAEHLTILVRTVDQQRFVGLQGDVAFLLARLARTCGHDADAVSFAVLSEELSAGEKLRVAPLRQRNALLQQARLTLPSAVFAKAGERGRQMTLDAAWARWRHLEQATSAPVTRVASELTAREHDVLLLLAQGHPDRRIARLLGISPTTASKHVSNMLSKLGLRNRVELARWASERERRT